ncbi:hypothetical protein ACP275_07G066400 [Erythranthe tilingii]
MDRTITNTVFFLFLLSMNFTHQIGAETKFMGKHTIHIYNRLPQKSSPLYLHCASKDDDFGDRTYYSGQTLTWNFRVNFWGTTLYFCSFSWKNYVRKFEVFRAGWDADSYRHTYSYIVNNEGIYLGYGDNPTGDLSEVLRWDDE